jgi:DNA gyrase subunit A
MGRGRDRIIVTELPYMTNKASLIERIASLAREGRLDGISDLRDESDRQGMRIVIELSKNANAEKVLADLYKRTPMQSTFSIIMLALVDGQPRLLSLKQALRVYLDHRLDVIKRRSEYELARAKERQHILEGYRIALENLDEIIDLIRKSKDAETAHERLMKRYKLSDAQTKAILDMPLRRLSALERKKIDEEYKEMRKRIQELEGLLGSPKKMRALAAQELQAVRETYGDRRRTQIVHMKNGAAAETVLTAQDFAPDKQVWVGVNEKGLISRSLEDKAPRPSGRDAPRWLLRANTRDTLFLIAEDGKAAALAVHSLPEADKLSDGAPVTQVSSLKTKTNLAAIIALPTKERRASGWHLLTATRQGMIKKSALEELPGPIAQSFRVANVRKDDALVSAALTDGKSEFLLATANGMAIRFAEEDVRPMGLAATGVAGIRLKPGDEVTGLAVVNPKFELFLLLSNGEAKRIKMSEFPVQGRYGQGVIAWKLPKDARVVGLAHDKSTTKATIYLGRLAPKSIRLDDAPVRGRPASGKAIVELKEGDQAVALTVPWEAPGGVAAAADKKKSSKSKGSDNGRKAAGKKATGKRATKPESSGKRSNKK